MPFPKFSLFILVFVVPMLFSTALLAQRSRDAGAATTGPQACRNLRGEAWKNCLDGVIRALEQDPANRAIKDRCYLSWRPARVHAAPGGEIVEHDPLDLWQCLNRGVSERAAPPAEPAPAVVPAE